jgi:DNA-binding SARP family transcriptional activator
VRLASLRLGSLAMAAVSLAAIGLLWRFRPEWPDLPDSLSSPVTTAFLRQLAVMAAWLLAALVILHLLVQILGDIRARRRLDLGSVALNAKTRESSRLRRPGSTLGILRPLVAEPKLIVVAPRQATSSNQPAALAETEPGDRPLISLLGPLAIYGGKRSRRGLRARALEVIAYLALRREGAQRDEILEAVWPGEDPKRSRHRLYQAVRDARRLLGDAVASERDRYWLDRSRARVDVDELKRLLDEASRTDADHRLQLLDNALALFRDEPLAGSDFHWAEGEVRRLRGTYVELLEEVCRADLKAGAVREALDAAERGLAVDVLNESLWRLAMRAESELGLRDSVTQRFEDLRTVLDERLGLEPDRETRALYLKLLGQT